MKSDPNVYHYCACGEELVTASEQRANACTSCQRETKIEVTDKGRAHLAQRVARRAKLIRACRHALLMHRAACEVYQERVCSLPATHCCVIEAYRHASHLLRRYNALESALSDATGLPKYSVCNELSNAWPVLPRLMTAHL